MKAQELLATQTEMLAARLANWLEKTRADRVEWQASTEAESNTRTALDMVNECAGVCHRVRGMLTGTEPQNPTPATTVEGATSALKSAAHELANTVRSLDDAALEKMVETPYGPMPGYVMASIVVTNMAYHGGQICFIQRLYGDLEPYLGPLS